MSALSKAFTHMCFDHSHPLTHTHTNKCKKSYASHSLSLTHPRALIIHTHTQEHTHTQHFCSPTSHCLHLIFLFLSYNYTYTQSRALGWQGEYRKRLLKCPKLLKLSCRSSRSSSRNVNRTVLVSSTFQRVDLPQQCK